MEVRVNPEMLPGIEREQWGKISDGLGDLVLDRALVGQLSRAERIQAESKIVTAYFEQKSPPYRDEIARVARLLPPMGAARTVQIVAPAYNEHESIEATLAAIVAAAMNSEADVKPSEWGVLLVVNRPINPADSEREQRDAENLRSTVSTINSFRQRYPAFNIDTVVVEAPRGVAGVGLARMVGHDIAAAWSSRRPLEERIHPMFIQTMDGDTTKLNSEFFRIIFDQLRSTNFEGDYYRQRDRFPREAIARFPLLHSFDFMWNDLISDLSMRTDQAWTIGRCTLTSVGAHCAAGGVMPFRLVNGVDEDIRIGTHINLLRNRRGERSHAIQIQEHVLESDPARALRGMSEVLDAVKRAGVGEPIPLTRDLHEAARLLKYYRSFHDLHLTDPLSYAEPNLGWLGSEGEFERALPRRALELCANSYFQLAQEELYLERLRDESRIAEMIYGLFESGRHPYSSARDLVFRWRAQKDLPQEVTGRPPLNPQVIESIHHDCAAEAAQLMCDILKRQGIIARVRSDVRGYAPATGKADEVLPQPIEVVESALYRAKLREMLM